MGRLVPHILQYGHEVSIKRGRLYVKTAQGNAPNKAWLDFLYSRLLNEISLITGKSLFMYTHFSTGEYSERKISGITLHFEIVGEEYDAWACFNVDLKRQRNSTIQKAGTRRPGKEFKPPPNGSLMKMLYRLGISRPNRLTRTHKSMYKLKGLILIGDIDDKNKISNSSIELAEVTTEEILANISNFSMRKQETKWAQKRHNLGTSSGHNKTLGSQYSSLLERNLSACNQNYNTSNHDMSDISILDNIPSTNTSDPSNQTVEEWLAEYSSP